MIKVGINSAGYATRVFHEPFLRALPQFEIVGIVDRKTEPRFPSYPVFTTYDAMLEDTQIELVIITTPNHCHFDDARRAILAGKHVLIEKPFATNSRDCQQLIDLANQYQRQLCVYHNSRFDSDFATIQSIIRSEKLGKIVSLDINWYRLRSGLNTKIHKEMVENDGSGLLFDLSPHMIDQSIQLFGFPVSVFADVGVQRSGSKVDDYYNIILFYNEGLRVTLKSSLLVNSQGNSGYILSGQLGSFTKPKVAQQEAQLNQGISPLDINYGVENISDYGILSTFDAQNNLQMNTVPSIHATYRDFYEVLANALSGQVATFSDAFEAQKIQENPLPVTAEQALQVVRVIEAAILSHHEQRVIVL